MLNYVPLMTAYLRITLVNGRVPDHSDGGGSVWTQYQRVGRFSWTRTLGGLRNGV